MILKSHLLIMITFALLTSILLALVKHDEFRETRRYALKLFVFMTGSVIIFSWLMRLL